jgi:DNA (cytosine-5)-methyltransferase 1
MTLTVGSLFSGIGGIDLGLERVGMTVRWQSEIDPYATRVLAKHWPTVPNLGDITQIDWENDGLDHGDGIARSLHVDVIAGGYPCQPFSVAGGRRGDTDPRHLWPHFHRAIRCLRPRYALLENVPGHLSLGFGDSSIGYDVEWCSIPAAAMGAPHLRWRLFAVAYPRDSARGRRTFGGPGRDGHPGLDGEIGTMADDVPDTVGDRLRQQPVTVTGCDGATVTRDDGTPRDVADTDRGGFEEQRQPVTGRPSRTGTQRVGR